MTIELSLAVQQQLRCGRYNGVTESHGSSQTQRPETPASGRWCCTSTGKRAAGPEESFDALSIETMD